MTWKVEACVANYFVNRQSKAELVDGKVKEMGSAISKKSQNNNIHVTPHKPSSKKHSLP